MLNRILLGLLFSALSVALLGCGQFNDNPKSDSPGTITLSIDGIQAQMGASNALTGPGGDPATTPAVGLVIGAVITTRSTPYTPELNITGDLEDQINDDLARSVNFFKIVTFPTSQATVTFNIPPASAGNWQIAALGLDPVPSYIADLGSTDQFDNAARFRGFTANFLNSDTVADTTITLNMVRACLIDPPPKGCARYDTDGSPIVTAAVEILDVIVNGVSQNADANPPLAIVRDASSVSLASTALSGLFSNPVVGETVTVVTTHQLSARESSACAALTSSSTVTQFKAACEVQTYTTPYQ